MPSYVVHKFFMVLLLSLFVLLPSPVNAAALRCGDAGDAVCELQERLAYLEYDLVVDGSYGSATEKAVRAFQQANGLEVDGIAGENTRDILLRLSPAVSRASRPLSDSIVSLARKFIGTPYVFGGTSAGGFDCSGFTQYVFRQVNVHLDRTADGQYNQGRSVETGALRAGDLVFFSTYMTGPSHVGIYTGGGYFIHSGSSTGVVASSLNEGYWRVRYIGAKRVMR